MVSYSHRDRVVIRKAVLKSAERPSVLHKKQANGKGGSDPPTFFMQKTFVKSIDKREKKVYNE